MSVGKITRLGLPFSNVVASGVATCNITPGRTIERMVLKLGGTTFTKAMISNIKLKANGKVFFDASGTQVDKLMAWRGITANANYLTLDFTEIRGRDKLDQVVGGFDTSKGISSLTAEVSIAGATAPTLEMYIIESGAQASAYSPVMTKVLRYPFSTSVGGKLPIPLPFGGVNGAVIKRITIDNATGTCNAVTCKQDGLVINESVKASNDYIAVEHGRVAQTGQYTVDFIVDGNQGNAWDTRDARSVELIPEFAAAASGDVIVEYYDVLGNL